LHTYSHLFFLSPFFRHNLCVILNSITCFIDKVSFASVSIILLTTSRINIQTKRKCREEDHVRGNHPELQGSQKIKSTTSLSSCSSFFLSSGIVVAPTRFQQRECYKIRATT
ncbi:unnamed protein product, partial [Thlaspi arvense]